LPADPDDNSEQGAVVRRRSGPLFGGTVSAGGAISLDHEAVPISVHERIALRDQGLRERDQGLRDWMAKVVVPAFLKANGLTLAAVAVLVVLDEINITSHLIAPGDRIITEKVIMALLGATTVQVGAIAALIARYLFPSRPA
jgi:hypothetical protein